MLGEAPYVIIGQGSLFTPGNEYWLDVIIGIFSDCVETKIFAVAEG